MKGDTELFKTYCEVVVSSNVKSKSIGTQKRDIDREPPENIGCFSEFIYKFATWLNEWMLSGKR